MARVGRVPPHSVGSEDETMDQGRRSTPLRLRLSVGRTTCWRVSSVPLLECVRRHHPPTFFRRTAPGVSLCRVCDAGTVSSDTLRTALFHASGGKRGLMAVLYAFVTIEKDENRGGPLPRIAVRRFNRGFSPLGIRRPAGQW